MTLIIKDIKVPIGDRFETKTCLQVFNNMGNFQWFDGTGLSDVQEWIDEQAFIVTMYRGWWHSFFFDHPDSFLLTKLMYPKYAWSLDSHQPEEFTQFYREWRVIYDAKQEAFKEKIRRQREESNKD